LEVNMIEAHEARLNVTYQGENGDLPDPVAFDAADGDVLQWASEAIRTGGVPGIAGVAGVNLTDFVVDRFPATGDQPNKLFVRPKTPFG
jgi:hypothetical protein